MPEKVKETYSFENSDEKEVEKFVGIEVYATSEIPGIGGVYKQTFKDFIVKEIDKTGKILDIKEDYKSPPFSKELKDQYSTFHLIKINRDTFEALRQISKALNVSSNFFNYSGLKDKQAVSVQKISIKGNYIEKLKKLNLHRIFIRNVYPTRKPVKLGSHKGNNFTIVIRNIEKGKNTKNLREKVEKLLDFLSKFGFPNYFGLQRFGNYRPNSHIIGHFLLLGDYKNAFNEYVSTTYSTESTESRKVRSDFRNDKNLEKAYNNFPKTLHYERKMIHHLIENPGDYYGSIDTLLPELRKLLISAFQSYLFNKMLSLRIKKGYPLFEPINGDVISILDDVNGHVTQVKYIYGESHGKYLKKAMHLNRASIVIPIIGTNTNLSEFPLMNSLLNEIIKQENIEEKIFHNDFINEREFKGSLRAMTVKPTGLKMLEFMDDDLFPGKKKVKLEFSLLKGCYATIFIRELIK